MLRLALEIKSELFAPLVEEGEEELRSRLLFALEPGEVEDLEDTDRIEDDERHEPDALLVPCSVPKTKTLPCERPDAYREEQDEQEYRVERERARCRAEERVLQEGVPHV